jgi:DNA-binding transcriptional LysR family regulator
LDLKQLRCFIAAAQEMHFGRAAEQLHIAPPALSRAIRALEEEVGVPLLERTTRTVTLTKAGLAFLEDAQAILSRTEDAARNAREAASNNSQILRIGAIDSASASILPEAIHKLRLLSPQADIRLIEAMTAPQLQMLNSGRLDIALIRPPMTQAEFKFESLRTEKLVVVMQHNHALANRKTLTMNDLRNQPLIIPAKRARPYAYDLVMAYFASNDTVPHIIQETTEKPAMLAMVAQGIGIALVPDWVAGLKRPGICFKQLHDLTLRSTPAGALVGMTWRSQQKHGLRDQLISELRKAARTYDPSEYIL